MPRRTPIDPEGYYHVSTRGNFGQPLFETADQHELYLDLYARSAKEFGWTTFGWSLIWNHHHFLVKLSDGGLSEGMRTINHGFSRRMNAAYGRTGQGHLVRHCFYAGKIEGDAHFRNACRYIERNAVAAGLCSRPQDWRWCGCAAALGLVPPRTFHDVSALLSHFGQRPGRARATYHRLVTTEPIPGKGYEIETSAGGSFGVVESPV